MFDALFNASFALVKQTELGLSTVTLRDDFTFGVLRLKRLPIWVSPIYRRYQKDHFFPAYHSAFVWWDDIIHFRLRCIYIHHTSC